VGHRGPDFNFYVGYRDPSKLLKIAGLLFLNDKRALLRISDQSRASQKDEFVSSKEEIFDFQGDKLDLIKDLADKDTSVLSRLAPIIDDLTQEDVVKEFEVEMIAVGVESLEAYPHVKILSLLGR
jgi:hypothetical protein